MFENIGHFFKRIVKTEQQKELGSKDAAKERLHLVLMQDRANVSADFLELMKQEIIDVIKKYIVVDEESIDVRLTNQSNDDGTNGAPSLYANIPIMNIKNDMMAGKIKSFEGVDFNKEMGIPSLEKEDEDNKQPETNNVIELSPAYEEKNNEIIQEDNNDNVENSEKIENTQNNEIKLEKKDEEIREENNEEIKENIEENKEELEEQQEVFEEVDDDDDDDVTFDDLLKAAEAADREMNENKYNNKRNERQKSRKSKNIKKPKRRK